MSSTVVRRPRIEDYRDADNLLRGRLDLYCANLVRIKSKSGAVVPFRWNGAQLAAHEALERQRANRGQVRALILKARQLGMSTYVGARYYRATTMWAGTQTYILTHEDQATQNLFGMVKRMHDHMPADYRLSATAANANELRFGGVDSGYRVGTAKNTSGAGRSQTIHAFHGSEVAFWPHAEGHFAGVMQAVPDARGTEVILESTANGVGGVFYEQWGLAESGQSPFVALFFPWYMASEYRRDPDQDWAPSAEEREYGDIYGLDSEQIAWAHAKNVELGGRPGELCSLFRQEYPANAAEAFQTSGEESLIFAEYVLAARRRVLEPIPEGVPRVIGVDVARGGGDLTRIVDRRGRRAGLDIDEAIDSDNLQVIADRVAYHLRRNPDIRKAFIDATGLGAGVYDILRSNGFDDRVVGVVYGARATDPDRYLNKRAEIWGRLKDWFADPVGVQIPDADIWQRHICGPGFRYDAHDRLVLESKEKIKKRLGFSPDIGDALAQTFAENVVVERPAKPSWRDELTPDALPSSWTTA